MEDDILAPFLNTVRDITQNFDTNLVELLEDYLRKIGINDIEADKVLDSKNFVEAAIMLQTSVNIYGKKVDYLWQLLMQVLEHNKMVGQKRAAEKKDGKKEEQELYFSPDFSEINNETLFCGDDVNINISDKCFPEIKFLPKYNPQLDKRDSDERNLILYSPQGNMIGQKYDFRVNKYLSSAGLLVDEPELYKGVGICHQTDTDSRMEETVPIGGLLIEDDSVEIEQCNVFEPIDDCCLPDRVSQYSKSRCSKAGSFTEKAAMCHSDSDKIINICEEAWKSWPFDKEVPNKRFVKKVTFKVPPDLVNITEKEIKRKVYDSSMEKRQTPSSILSFMETNFETRAMKRNAFLFGFEYFCLSYGLKKPDREKPSLSKLQDEFDEMAKKLAEEFNEDYDLEEDGTRDTEEDKVEDDGCFGDENCDVAEDDLQDLGTYVNDIKFPALDQLGDELETNDLMIPRISENDLSYMQFALEACCIIPLERESFQGISSEVREWHDKLRPQLQEASERGHFDINAYSAKIVNSFTEVEVTSEQSMLPFGDIVKGETSKDVARFFFATLILANSYNVEISKGGETKLEMDCVNLTLLNPVLNHECGNTNMENLCEKDDSF